MNEYEPATCNIGRGERRRRAIVSALAFGGAVLYLSICLVADVPTVLFGGVFVPLAIGFEWVIQAHAAFCVRLALLNRYDFRSDGGEVGEVADPQSERADRIQAAKITVGALVFAGFTTALVLVLL